MFLFLLLIYSGGLSNFLYYCALPSGAKPKQGEPSKVLVRFYGQIHGEGALEALLTESVIFTLLSERKLGPKLHGIFPGGRLEEFIAVIIPHSNFSVFSHFIFIFLHILGEAVKDEGTY